MGLYRIEHYSEPDRLLGLGPHSKGKPSSRAKDAMSLRQCSFGSAQMEQSKIHDHCIKRPIRKWQVLGITLAKVDHGIMLASLSNHGRGKINPYHIGASLGRNPCHIAGTSRDIEQSHPSLHLHGIEKRPSRLTRQVSKGAVVLLRDLLPTFVLKRAKRLGLNKWCRHMAGPDRPSDTSRSYLFRR